MAIQINIKYEEEVVGKLKVIAWKELKSLTVLAQELARDKINKYEKANGPITKDEINKVSKI